MNEKTRFLHNHPNKEKELGLDENHVIVDKDAWQEAQRRSIDFPISPRCTIGEETKEVFNIQQVDYHYYWELSAGIAKISIEWQLVQIISLGPSGDNKKMHRATVLFKKNVPVK